jgi:hypothetical protein
MTLALPSSFARSARAQSDGCRLAHAQRQALSPACRAFLTEAAAWTARRGRRAAVREV